MKSSSSNSAQHASTRLFEAGQEYDAHARAIEPVLLTPQGCEGIYSLCMIATAVATGILPTTRLNAMINFVASNFNLKTEAVNAIIEYHFALNELNIALKQAEVDVNQEGLDV